MTLHHGWVATDTQTGTALYTRYLECNTCHLTLPLWEKITGGRLVETGTALRYEAESDGWTQKQDSDYCPECSQQNRA